MKIKDILAKVAKKENLTDDELKFLSEYDEQKLTDAAAANAPLVRAGAEGVTVPVAKPVGGSAFFKVIVSDRAR